MNRLVDKVAIITGAAKGIGAVTARLFANEGCQVLATDILDDEALKFVALSTNIKYFHLDVSKPQEWEECFKYCVAFFGKVDILFNNAGIMGTAQQFGPQDPEHASFDSWKRIHDINLNSVFLGCKTAIKYMKAHGGSIINMSSRSGIVGIPTSAAYSSSKAAIRNFTKSVALYCAQQKYNIRCNSIHPAAIETDIWRHMFGETQTERESAIRSIAKGIPLGRMGTPLDVANLAVYLASDESSFMTGSEIVLDGGILAGSASPPRDKK